MPWLQKNEYCPQDIQWILLSRHENVNMNNRTHLERLGLKPEDVWEAKVFGSFGEPIRCYIYHPRGPRSSGFTKSVSETPIADKWEGGGRKKPDLKIISENTTKTKFVDEPWCTLPGGVVEKNISKRVKNLLKIVSWTWTHYTNLYKPWSSLPSHYLNRLRKVL